MIHAKVFEINRSRIYSFLFPTLFLLGFAESAFPASYYVSPSGNDSNTGSLSSPFQTVGRAVTAAQAGDAVYLRQGVYRETLVPIRSGLSGSPIVFSGYSGESAVLCGTNVIQGTWTLYQGSIYKFTGAAPTTALFVDGHMMQEARWPNAPVDSYFSNFATCGTGTTATQVVDSNLPALNLNGARVHIIPGSAWVSNTSGVTNYGGGSFSFTTAIGSSAPYQAAPGNLYFLYGSLTLLDSPGEWFQDPSTGTIYLWTPNGSNPGTHLVEEAARKRVVDDNSQSYIDIQNLFTFAGGMFFTNCAGCLVDGVNQKYVQHYTEVNGFGAEGDQNGFSGGSGNIWRNGSIQYSAGNGLYLNGTGQTVTNMVISDVCYIATYRGCIQSEGSGHHIEYNTLHDSGRFCVWHDKTTGGFIRHNQMFNAGLITKDVGATYAYMANGAGLEISYNQIHDTHAYIGNGVYLDNGCSNFLVHHNVVYLCDYTGIKLNYASLNNRVFNNTIANCKYWTQGSGSNASQAGTSIINNLGVGTGTFQYLTGTNGAVFLNSGTYLPASFVPGGYQLAAGSGAIDKGMILPGITDGYFGSAPDVGAYEYGGTAWSAGATVIVPAFPYPFSANQPTSTPSPTPTSTRTLTLTPSRTATSTPSSTSTKTASSTPTLTNTATSSSSATASLTPTASSTRTGTPTSTSSGTATLTPTSTNSTTATSSFTPSRTPTSTPSATSTLTSSPTATLTATNTSTDSMTPSATASQTRTNSSTPTGTASLTASPSATPSKTPTTTQISTNTATSSPSGTPTWTGTATTSLTPTASSTRTGTSTSTSSETPTQTLTSTNTPVPPTATPTNSPVPPTITNTPVPPTSTRTNTPVPPTSTFTAIPATATRTNTPVPPTPTLTPTNTATSTNTFTAVPPTATSTRTSVPPTATFTAVAPTATNTPVASSTSLKVQLLSGVTTDTTTSPHPQIRVVNTGAGPLNLNSVTVKYWLNCDCTNQIIQAWVDWAGLMPAGTNVTGNVQPMVQATTLGGQTNVIVYTFTGNLVLLPGQAIQVQSRFNKNDWSNMTQWNDWSFAPYTSFTDWVQVAGYISGGLVWGEEPVSAPAALTVSSALVFPNPSTGNGSTLSFNLNGGQTGATGSSLDFNHPLLQDPNAKITLSIYTTAMRLIWTQTLTGGSYGTTGEHELYWSERDIKGAKLSNGLYILRVTVESNGQKTSTIAKILILG